MWKFCAGALAVLMLVPAARAQDDTEKEVEPPTPTQQVTELVREHRSAMSNFMVEYRKVETAEERQTLMKEMYPQPAEYAAKFMEIIESHPDDPGVQQAISWIFQYASTTPSAATAAKFALEQAAKDPEGPQTLNTVIMVATRSRGPVATEAAEMLVKLVEAKKDDPTIIVPLASLLSARTTPKELAEKATQILIDNFVDNDQLAMVCMRLGNPDALRQVIEKTTNELVKGHAMYSLGKALAGRPVKANKEAEELFAKVVSDYADIASGRSTLGKLAEGPLFEMQHLQIGMAAPNIQGEDLDTEAFQLADYKGKVVMLDFWGDW